MANRFLKPIYHRLYGEVFSYSDFSDRLMMQKGIYLLQEMGVPVGNYRFTWYKHGPYSQSLLDDMYIAPPETKVRFTFDVESAISLLSEALKVPDDVQYPKDYWVECLGSLHYLKTYYCSSSATDDEIIEVLMAQKKHLNSSEANKIALNRIHHLFT